MADQNQIMDIARRIAELRDISDITVDEMAEQLGLDKATYEKYESGQTDIPISVLIAIGEIFHIELAALLTGSDAKLAMYSLCRLGEGVDVARQPGYKYQSLAYNFAGKVCEPFMVTVQPHETDTPVAMNSHDGQEFDLVMEGQLRIVIDNHEMILNAGDCIYFNSSYPHGMQAVGDCPVRFLAIVL